MFRLKAEVISIGDELLSGAIVNRNAAFISKKLQELGIDVVRQVSLPDNPELLREGLEESLACVPLVIATGGLGPTLDDNTRKVAADLFHSPLEFNPHLAEEMRKRFGNLESLEDQATIPVRAEILPNYLGTASGLILLGPQSTLILLPGVPLEMEALVENAVIPYLRRCFTLDPPLTSCSLHFFNAYESQFDTLLREIQGLYSSLQIGIYPKNGLVTIHLKGDDLEVEKAASAIRAEFGEREFEAEDGKIETALHRQLIAHKFTLSAAESCTGGAFSSRLTAIPDASCYFLGGVVAYSNALKEQLLGVDPQLLLEKGAVSAEVAIAMAEGIQKLSGSDCAVAMTGIAGPGGGSSEKPVGTVYIAIKKKGAPAQAFQIRCLGSRIMIIDCAASFALGALYRNIFSK